VDLEARQLRQEMKRRGHITVPKRGEDPEQVRQSRFRAITSCVRLSSSHSVRLTHAIYGACRCCV